MAVSKISALVLMTVAATALAGCQDGAQPFGFLKGTGGKAAAGKTATAATPERSVKLVDRDVEAPEIFHVTAKGLWDGRPSLGGVWAAYPGVQNPERVIIRNPKSGKFVIGALFRREDNNPGPKLQLSSDAATALGLYAGEPATVSVTALRREEAPVPAPDAKAPALAANEQITSKPLASEAAPAKPGSKPVAEVASKARAAIEKAQNRKAAAAPKMTASKTAAATTASAVTSARKPEARPKAAAKPAPASGARDYLQIGIFSVEANANRAANMVSKAGALVHIRTEKSHGKTFWRVVAGPATSATQRQALKDSVKKLGFNDAYYVTR
ncbi:hypothetical protein U879_17825 [Defluviimonas sp. 20V17]|uniref:Cell division protein DedD (Protein involved in septation) n=1 Tax=Allgaiera indica TaxID=765699 RepID=A0AAN4USJ1_9RHOB|nr:SPOR domain-containing protein [Allgaiera indica]KDB02322.1 hypothetical protein U879_17825 [Defluviimonas sp. 20V17]GHE02892.1 sporulation protein [Allgaiera indica]SDX16240.1 Cell division protein DedD (protein involved in septation) [Allgaiera indica]